MASENIILRSASEAEVPMLVRLLQRSWLVTWAPELPFEAVQRFASSDPARSYVENCWQEFVVASRAEAVAGMVHVVGNKVAALHVDPGSWDARIGTKLLDAAERQIAASHSVACLDVLSFNVRAQVFYQRRGWEEVRRFTGDEYGSPVESIEMHKVL